MAQRQYYNRYAGAADLGDFLFKIGAESRRGAREDRQDIRRMNLAERQFEAGEKREARAVRGEERAIKKGELAEERFQEFQLPQLQAKKKDFETTQAYLDSPYTAEDTQSEFGKNPDKSTQWFLIKNSLGADQATFHGHNPKKLEGGQIEIDDGKGGRKIVTKRDMRLNPDFAMRRQAYWLTKMDGNRHLELLSEQGNKKATAQLKKNKANPKAALEWEIKYKEGMLEEAVKRGSIAPEEVKNFMAGINESKERLRKATSPEYKLAIDKAEKEIKLLDLKIAKAKGVPTKMREIDKEKLKFAQKVAFANMGAVSALNKELQGLQLSEGETEILGSLDTITRGQVENAIKTISAIEKKYGAVGSETVKREYNLSDTEINYAVDKLNGKPKEYQQQYAEALRRNGVSEDQIKSIMGKLGATPKGKKGKKSTLVRLGESEPEPMFNPPPPKKPSKAGVRFRENVEDMHKGLAWFKNWMNQLD